MPPPLATSRPKISTPAPTYNPPNPTLSIPKPVPPPIYNVLTPKVIKPLTDYMVKALAWEMIATAKLRYGITFCTDDLERAIKSTKRF